MEVETSDPTRLVYPSSIRNLVIVSCLLFLVQNVLFYINLYSIAFDVMGAMTLSLALFLMYLKKNNKILAYGGGSFLGWGIGTILWRSLIFLEPEILEYNLYGYLNLTILFGFSSILFFISIFIFIKIMISSHIFYQKYIKKERFPGLYIKFGLLYGLLHLVASSSVVIGTLSTDLLILLELGLFFKLFIVPIFGLLTFGGTIYILRDNR